MPDLWLAEVSEWYEFSKERAMPEDGSLNPPSCSSRCLNTEDRDVAFNLKDERMNKDCKTKEPNNVPAPSQRRL